MTQDLTEAGGIAKFFFGKAIGARLARGGAVAFGIRMLSVVSSYFMFVVLAHHMSKGGFGQFGFAFSLATFVAVIAALGQPILVLRFIPTYQNDEDSLLLKGLIRDSRIAVLLGSATAAAAMLIGSIAWIRMAGTDSAYLLWTALLMVAMTVSRHQAYLMRAFGNIALALAPRDVVWRLVVIVCVMVFARNATISASYAVNLCSLTLIAILAIQMFAHPATRPVLTAPQETASDRPVWMRESLGIWPVTVVQAAGPNVSVIVLGLVLTPEETGPYFAAMKTAMLLTLPLAAGAIVGAPLISRYYHEGKIHLVQKISSYLVIGITIPVLAGFILVLFFGDLVLGMFGPEFSSANLAMILIASGALINALSGPTGFIMNMTGHHRQYLLIMLVTQAASLSIQPVAAIYFGMEGAAATVAAGMVSWNFWVWWWCRKNLSIDPTIYGTAEWFIGRARRLAAANE